MSTWTDQQRDTNRLRQRADETDRARSRAAEEDVVIDGPRRLLLRATSGDYFAVSVDDAGKLTTTNIGPNAL